MFSVQIRPIFNFLTSAQNTMLDSNIAHHSEHITLTVKHGGGGISSAKCTMLWGWVSSGTGKLARVEGMMDEAK